MRSQITFPLTIYYDASCPLCRTEMETLKQADDTNQLILVDCSHTAMQLPDSCPVTREALMNRIHAQDAMGRWITGVDVFAAAYTVTGFTKMGKLWSSRILRPLLSRAYPWWQTIDSGLAKRPYPGSCINLFLEKLPREVSSPNRILSLFFSPLNLNRKFSCSVNVSPSYDKLTLGQCY